MPVSYIFLVDYTGQAHMNVSAMIGNTDPFVVWGLSLTIHYSETLLYPSPQE